MNLIRLIVIALIVYLLIRLFKRWAQNKNSTSSTQQKNMVQCEVCQLHIPEDEALQQDGMFYCSQAHLDNK